MQDDPLQHAIHQTRGRITRAVRARILWIVAASIGVLVWGFLVFDRTFEPSPDLRRAAWILLAVVGLVWLVARAAPAWWARLSDLQIAALLARNLSEGADAVITSVEAQGESTDAMQQTLLEGTREQANRSIESVSELNLVRDPSKSGWAFAAVILWGSVVYLAIASPETAQRLIDRATLSPHPWPRSVRLEPIGFEQDETTGQWQRKVARGSRVEVLLDAVVEEGYPMPRRIEARIDRGVGRDVREGFARVGAMSDEGRQRFRLGDQLVSGDLRMVIAGGDASIGLNLLAVSRPVLTQLRVKVIPPAYLGLPSYESDAASLSEAPEGSDLMLNAQISKLITEATASFDSDDKKYEPLPVAFDVGRGEFVVEAPGRIAPGEVLLEWTDTDGIPSDPSFRLPIRIKADQPPSVRLTKIGVGGLITPRALIGTVADAIDDYNVSEIALLVSLDDNPTVRLPLEISPNKRVQAEGPIDLLSFRDANGAAFEAAPGQTLRIVANASDRYNLKPRGPSRSETIELQIVEDQELLIHLAVVEQRLRAALEAALSDAQRLAYTLDRASRGVEGAVNRGVSVETKKLTEAIRAVEEGFQSVRDEVVNNRLDQPVMVARIESQIVAELDRCRRVSLRELEEIFGDGDSAMQQASRASPIAEGLVAQIEKVLSQIDSSESYNQLVAELRDLIRDQRRVNQQTQRQRDEERDRLLFD